MLGFLFYFGNNKEQGVLSENRGESDQKTPIKTLQKSFDNIQGKQNEIQEKQEEILKELQTIREEFGGKMKNPLSDKNIREASNSDSDEKVGDQEVSNLNTGKFFVLKTVFENMSEMEIGDNKYGLVEEHFGCPWRVEIEKTESYLRVNLRCEKPLNVGKWSIDTEFEFRLKSSNEILSWKYDNLYNNEDGEDSSNGYGVNEFLNWAEMMEDYCIDDKITVEVHVKINKMTGVYKKDLRSFDESMAKFSDVVLVVGGQKFYVSKLFLAARSSYFEVLFLGPHQESSKSEIKLIGIDSNDFQNYLEVLYGCEAIDETTVEGILRVADMFITKDVIQKCEDFLIEKSKKAMKKKLQLGMKYNLDKMKEKCLSEIK